MKIKKMIIQIIFILYQDKMTSCDIIATFRKNQSCFSKQKDMHVIVDSISGCMVSKWTSVEFKNITSADKNYLHVVCVYMQPFSDFDYFDFTIQVENAPKSLLKLYEYAKQNTSFRTEEADTVIIVPYIYKQSKTILRRCKTDDILTPYSPSCVYISEPNHISFVDKIFSNKYL